MTPQPQQHDPWTDVPALQRMREDLEQVTARDARAGAPAPRRRGPRRQLGLAFAGVLAVVVVGLSLVAGGGDEAVADLRDAPAALLEAGRYAFTTESETFSSGRTTRFEHAGEVDLKAEAFRYATPTRAGRTVEAIVTPEAWYVRTVRPGEPDPTWGRSPPPDGGATLAGDAVPISLASVRALKDAGDERVVAEDEQVDGIATTHYRLPMTADKFAGLRGQDAAALRDVQGTLDVWLDGDDLPRRLRASFASADRTARYTIDTRYERFGRTEPVRAPATSRPANDAPLGRDPVVGSMLTIFD